ncbi:Hypothetical protein CINCED_3A012092 [Cinara cedri]|uniref:Reverse transcriptase domain n=1 Tax=Cinara cedri TaxID=506608 RepID=A0A5E4NIV8_9HEMI|nr:Hypothetical protein CINCED_3A012092 [Cinara cedri]
MDEVMKKIRGKERWAWCMMFTSDIILIGENLEEVNNRLGEWKMVLEGKRLRISKTKFIEHEFGRTGQKVDKIKQLMTINGDEIGEVESFNVVGKSEEKRCCDKRIQMRLKGKVYRSVIETGAQWTEKS